jgi:hypothetical protein
VLGLTGPQLTFRFGDLLDVLEIGLVLAALEIDNATV